MATNRQGMRLACLAAVLALSGLAGCKQLLESRPPLGTCGDGTIQAGEECDDGNQVSGDGCSAGCKKEVCGNGVVDSGEECDNGLANDNSGDCTLACKKARCGDGFVKSRGSGTFEVCDDGNELNGDGCNPQCMLRGRLSVLAGIPGGRGVQDGVGSAARVSGVHGLVSDGQKLYFWDNGACAVRSLEVASGRVTTIAGVPGDCLQDKDGPGNKATFQASGTGIQYSEANILARVADVLYVVEGGFVRTVELSGSIHQVKSCGWIGSPDDDPTMAVASDPEDPTKLYVATSTKVSVVDLPCACKAALPYGQCATQLLAGSIEGHKDGVGAAAQFLSITSLVVATEGAEKVLYIADFVMLRRLHLSTKQVDTVAGGFSPADAAHHKDAVKGLDARFLLISGLAYSKARGLYVLQWNFAGGLNRDLPLRYGWSTVRHVDPANDFAVTTIAGVTGTVIDNATPETDGFGAQARLVNTFSAVVAGDTLYIGGDSAIRAMSLASEQLATAAGVLVQDFRYQATRAIAASQGTLYAGTRGGDLLALPVSAAGPARKVSTCTSSLSPNMIVELEAMTASGRQLFYIDRYLPGICHVYLDGKDAQGAPAGEAGCTDCLGTWARVYPPPNASKAELEQAATTFRRWGAKGLVYDGSRYLYLMARTAQGLTTPFDPARIIRLDTRDGSSTEVKTATALPMLIWGGALVEDRLYVTAAASDVVSVVDLKSGSVRTLGDGLPGTIDSGVAGGPRFCNPVGITSDGQRLFVGEGFCDRSGGTYQGHAIRQIELEGEKTTTLLGPGPVPYVVTGTGHQAGVNWPAALTYDALTGHLFVADMWDNAILSVD